MDVKGFYFTLDAMLAGALVISAILFLSHITVDEQTTETITFTSKDLLTSFSELRVDEIDDPTVQQMITDGTIDDANNTVLEQLGEFWALNQTTNAANFTNAVMAKVVPERFSAEIRIRDDVFYRENRSSDDNVVTARRMVTGVKKGAALRGSTASAYLKQIRGKRSSSYLYFGGFVGQGNITGYINDIPSDVNTSDVINITMEADMERNFSVTINGDACGSYTPTTANMTADRFVLPCTSAITPGNNTVNVTFDDVNGAYIGGGFIKVTYVTENKVDEAIDGTERHYLPGIDGVVNLYDAFYVPGNVSSISAYIHYEANHSVSNNTFYLTIGNQTVYNDTSSNTTQFVYLDSGNLSLNYSFLDEQTVPVRMGFENLSYNTEYTGNADVMLITDVSGSMEWRLDADYGGTRRNCDDPGLNTSSTTRLSLAKCLDKDFAVDIVNITGNQVGLASYDSNAQTGETVEPTTNLTRINDTVGIADPETGYEASGGTAICAGINEAYDTLANNVQRTEHITSGEEWLYYNESEAPSPDADGDAWYEQDYDDTAWYTGDAVLGSNENFVGPSITTDMGSQIASSALYPDIYEVAADQGTVPAEFDNGLNQSGNTFGSDGAVDGWDSAFGYFGTGGHDVRLNVDPDEDGDQSDNTVANDDELRISIGDAWDDDAPSDDEIPDSAAYGVDINITPAMYNMLQSPNGSATVYFDWRINPTNDLYEEESGWIKAGFGTTGDVAVADRDEGEDTSDVSYTSGYTDSTGCICDSPSGGGCAQSTGSVGTPEEVSTTLENASGDYRIRAVYCDENDDYSDPDEWYIDVDGSREATWSTDTGGSSAWQTYETDTISVDSGDAIDVGCARGSSSTYCRLDYVEVVEVNEEPDMTYLGSNLDENASINDASNEVFWCMDDTGDDACPNPGSGSVAEAVTSAITGPGQYYLVLGAKASENLGDDTWDENWRFAFDNVYVEVSNESETYYLRKHFNIADTSLARQGVINLLVDDKATLYVNGNKIHDENATSTAAYWSHRGIRADGPYFRTGDNVVAAKLENAEAAAKFDLSLATLNTTRDKAMMVMTDGQATQECARQGTGSPEGDAIRAACDAAEDYGMDVYSVGFSDGADESTLQGMASCGNGIYRKSSNVEALEEFYADVARSIITASRQSQTVVVSEGFAQSRLYPDSYIDVEYEPDVEEPGPNELGIRFQSEQFNSCTPTVDIPSGLRILDARITSYSAEHWTDRLDVNGNTVYNLSRYSSDYTRLGDPYTVEIPPGNLGPGTNQLSLKTGDSPLNTTGCSANNTLIYEAAVNLSTPRSDVVEDAVGCTWTVEFESGSTSNFSIPQGYNGSKTCTYTSGSVSYDDDDAYDAATHDILDQLDFDDDGRVLVNFVEEDLEVVVTLIRQVPYLWGPAITEVVVWQ